MSSYTEKLTYLFIVLLLSCNKPHEHGQTKEPEFDCGKLYVSHISGNVQLESISNLEKFNGIKGFQFGMGLEDIVSCLKIVDSSLADSSLIYREFEAEPLDFAGLKLTPKLIFRDNKLFCISFSTMRINDELIEIYHEMKNIFGEPLQIITDSMNVSSDNVNIMFQNPSFIEPYLEDSLMALKDLFTYSKVLPSISDLTGEREIGNNVNSNVEVAVVNKKMYSTEISPIHAEIPMYFINYISVTVRWYYKEYALFEKINRTKKLNDGLFRNGTSNSSSNGLSTDITNDITYNYTFNYIYEYQLYYCSNQDYLTEYFTFLGDREKGLMQMRLESKQEEVKEQVQKSF